MGTLGDQPDQDVDVLGVVGATLILETNLINIDLIESTCHYHLRHLVRDEVVGKRLHANLKWHVKSRACDLQLAGLQ